MSAFKIDVVAETAIPGRNSKPEYTEVYQMVGKHDPKTGVIRITVPKASAKNVEQAIRARFKQKDAKQLGFSVGFKTHASADKVEIFIKKTLNTGE